MAAGFCTLWCYWIIGRDIIYTCQQITRTTGDIKKTARGHEHSNYALKVALALGIPGASLDIIRRIHRCWGYGQRHDEKDRKYYYGLQKIMESIEFYKAKERNPGHDPQRKAESFFPRDSHDSLQHKVLIV